MKRPPIDFSDPNWPEHALARRKLTVLSASDTPFAAAAVETRLGGGPRKRSPVAPKPKVSKRRSKRWATYGPGSRVYETQLMHQAQGGKCANHGCNAVIAPIGYGRAVDRDPSTGRPLAILCKACSVALGVTRRRRDILIGLLDYLNTHSQK